MPSTQRKMKPMFLPGVEQNPQPGPYASDREQSIRSQVTSRIR